VGQATNARTIAPATIRAAFSVGSGVGESVASVVGLFEERLWQAILEE